MIYLYSVKSSKGCSSISHTPVASVSASKMGSEPLLCAFNKVSRLSPQVLVAS